MTMVRPEDFLDYLLQTFSCSVLLYIMLVVKMNIVDKSLIPIFLFLLYVCVFAYTCLFIRMYLWECSSMCMNARPENHLGCCFSMLSILFLRSVSFWRLLIRQSWLASKPQGSTCLLPLSTGIITVCPTSSFVLCFFLRMSN